ncbi:DNA topoisomerase 2 [Venturia inaequalis]|nr:DNA topoisomerase 2 [Venturia inaequalis]
MSPSQYGYSYTIRRITAPGEPVDACAPLDFSPPKGSDELHEALKLAFPFEPTLQARMRQAVINFHLSEAQADVIQESSFVDPTSRDASDPPAQEELMGVWCLPSLPAAKIHTRRNMTAEEKKAYKAKRLAGACADCKRRRRKCHHDPSNPTGPALKNAVKTRKRSAVAKSPAVKAYAATSSSNSSSLALTPALPVQDPCTFAPQDNSFAFGSDFNTSMLDDMSFAMGFENAFGNHLGFDLRNDFDLFPDTATNARLSSAGIDAASWLAESSPNPLLVDNRLDALSRGFNSWPMDPWQAYNTAGVPLTPQSLSPQSLMMSRSQSGHSSSSSSLISMFGGNNAAGFNQPAFDQDASDFVLHSPQSLLVSPKAGSRSSQRTPAGPAIPSQQSVPTWSPQDVLDSTTTSFPSGTSRGSTSSSEHMPVASWIGTALLNHDFTHYVSDAATNPERCHQHPVDTVSSGNGSSSSSSPSRTTTASSSQASPVSSGQDERARLKSTDPGPPLGHSRRIFTRMASSASFSEQEQNSGLQFGGTFLGSQLIANKNSERIASGPRVPRPKTAKATYSGHSSSENMQPVFSSDLISQTGYLKTSDRHIDMSKLCRLKHSSAAADDVCRALQSSFDLPPFDGLASGTIVPGANVFQWIILLLFAAMHMFCLFSSFSSSLVSTIKTNKFLELVVDSDSSKKTRDISTRVATRDVAALQKELQPYHRYSQRALEQCLGPWHLFSGLMLQTVSRLGGKVGKMQSKAGRTC